MPRSPGTTEAVRRGPGIYGAQPEQAREGLGGLVCIPPGNQAFCSSLSFLAIADLRFAAWFLWMMPLATALSS